VAVDGVPYRGAWRAFPDGWRYAEVVFNDDLEHRLEASRPVAAYSHGYSSGGSYASEVLRRFEAERGCRATAGACVGPVLDVCPGTPFSLDVSDSFVEGCALGLEVDWTRDGVPEPGWSGQTAVQATVSADTVFEATVACAGDPACSDAARFFAGTGADPVPPDQGNVLRAVREGNDVRLGFRGAPAVVWRVDRKTDKAGAWAPATGPLFEASWPDAGAVSAAEDYFYALRGLSPCTFSPGP
jgi:hypothetical protein